jgi:hypothetical protein
MLKGKTVDREGKPVMIVGLSGENVTRLAAGEPIYFDASEFGLPGCKVMLLYGKTELDIIAALRANSASLTMKVKARDEAIHPQEGD